MNERDRGTMVGLFDEVSWYGHQSMTGHHRGVRAIERILKWEGFLPADYEPGSDDQTNFWDELDDQDLWATLIAIANKHDIELEWGLETRQ